MDPQVGQSVDGPSFSLWSICCSCSCFAQEHFCVKIFEMSWWDPPLKEGSPRGVWTCVEAFLSTGGALYRFYLPLICEFQLKSSPLCPGNIMFPWCLWTSYASPHFLTLPATFFVQFPDPLYLPHILTTFWHWPLISSSSSVPPRSPMPQPPTLILFAPQCRIEAGIPWSSFLLRSIVSEGCITGIVKFRANIHLWVNTYHVCSFVSGLPHSGWYFLDLPFAYTSYEVIVFNCFVVFCSVTTFSVSILL